MAINIFEKLYGYLFRNLAKSILSTFDKQRENEYLTIGILLYSPFDESFYYAPTLKNSLLFTNEIKHSPFATTQELLWNKELMIAFGKFLSQPTIKGWVNELFEENNELITYKASSYAITFESYDRFKDDWLNWFKINIDYFSDDTVLKKQNKKQQLLLNQLFHFGNYLITITRRAAFISKSSIEERTYAESIYMCISNPILTEPSRIFDIHTGDLNEGNDITWKAEPRTQELKARLNFALEVCYRWPFGVNDKIKVLNSLRGHGHIDRASESYSLNATATPLIYNGEFLGICYLSQSIPNKSNLKKLKVGNRTKTLKDTIKESSITGFIYTSRFETARIALQKIDAESFKKSTMERVFELCHIYSSSPLVAYINEVGDLFFRYRIGNELVKKMKSVKSLKSGNELIEFLKHQFNKQNFNVEQKETYAWFDIDPTPFNAKQPIGFAYEKINPFNDELTSFLSPSIRFNPEQLKITSINFLKYEIENSIVTIILFNSNFTLLFNTGISSSNIKKSYALKTHNNIRLLIETEQIHRRLYEQGLTFEENMRKGFLHYFRGSLSHKIKRYLDTPLNDDKRLTIIDNCNILIDRMGDLLEVYKKNRAGKPTNLKTIYEAWNDCIKGYDRNIIGLDEIIINSATEINCLCNLESLIIIFEEQIQNAFNIYNANPKQKIRLTLFSKKRKEFLTIGVICFGSNMQTKYIQKAGIDAFPSSESSGIGFIITELLLYRMGALKIGKRHFDLINRISPKSLTMLFKLNIVK